METYCSDLPCRPECLDRAPACPVEVEGRADDGTLTPESSHRSWRAPRVPEPSLYSFTLSFVMQKLFSCPQLYLRRNCSLYLWACISVCLWKGVNSASSYATAILHPHSSFKKLTTCSLASVPQLFGALSCKLKGRRFGSRSGHMPRLQVAGLIPGQHAYERASDRVSPSHRSLTLSPPSSLSKTNEKVSLSEDEERK